METIARSDEGVPVADDLQIHGLGPLFEDIQRGGVFEDSKILVDCSPRRSLADIRADYEARKSADLPFDLKEFVRANFTLPNTRNDIRQHITMLWDVLRREPDEPVPGSSLLPLPEPYVVPGGRFRELYYWDSYFIMLGLRASGKAALVRSMLKNFAYLIRRYGHVPNGNRSYYLTRSQPPCFALMLELAAEEDGPGVLTEHVEALRLEYEYWMDRTARSSGHRVCLPGGAVLNRYCDQSCAARPEAFVIDQGIAARARRPAAAIMRDLRSAAESGWDFSTRWFGDGHSIETIRTTEILPVDLNCLVYRMERTLARAAELAGRPKLAQEMRSAADRRREAILNHFWSDDGGFFCDYDLKAEAVRKQPTLAGVFPLFVKIARPAQAASVAAVIQDRFLHPGGLITTLQASGQQWDAPNGWAPLHWMAVRGLENYGYSELAREIATRWVRLNREVYDRTGRLMEKYNVVDVGLEAGGGEYPTQDGFGWTNGVLIALLQQYP